MNALVLVVGLMIGPSVFEGRGLLLSDAVVRDQPIIPALTPDCKLANRWCEFVNHCSDKPTAYVDSGLWLRASADLESMTELTVNYNATFGFTTPRGTFCVLKPADPSFRRC